MEDKFNILDELKEAGAVALISLGNKNCFFVPDNYFDSLASSILEHVLVKSLPSINPYTVAESYFENLPDIILDKIKMRENLSPVIDVKNLYSVPDGYFNGLANSILNKIKGSSNYGVEEELAEISPLLRKIPKINVYSVPENYFEESSPLAAVNPSKPQAKIISLGSRTFKWISYAAAACIATILFGGGYFYLENHKNYPTLPLTKDVQKQISLLTDDEIANYLEDNNNIGIYTNSGEDDYQPQNLNIQNMLEGVSEEEIQQDVNENAELTKEGEGI